MKKNVVKHNFKVTHKAKFDQDFITLLRTKGPPTGSCIARILGSFRYREGQSLKIFGVKSCWAQSY